MNRPLLLLIGVAVIVAFGVWSVYVSSRYQALCELSYWSASADELRLCDERASELKGR
jgi:hypothetical protein